MTSARCAPSVPSALSGGSANEFSAYSLWAVTIKSGSPFTIAVSPQPGFNFDPIT
jgi:hypothetical protein